MSGKNGTKNKLMHLNDHLFAQIERLGDEDLSGEKLFQEIARAKAVTGVATQIINNARVVVEGMKAYNEGLIKKTPRMLGIEEKESI